MCNKTLQSYVRHLERVFDNKDSSLQCLTQKNCLLSFAGTIHASKGLLERWKVFCCVRYLNTAIVIIMYPNGKQIFSSET